MKLALVLLAPLALAAPLAHVNGPNDNHAVAARNVAANDLALTHAERAIKPDVAGDVATALTNALHAVQGLADDVIEAVVNLVQGLLTGKGLDFGLLPKILSAPKAARGQIVPAVQNTLAGLNIDSGLIGTVLNLLKSLLGGIPFQLTNPIRRDGSPVDAVTSALGPALSGLGIVDELVDAVVQLVKSLLGGSPMPSADKIAQLSALPVDAKKQIFDTVRGILSQIPILGDIVNIILSLLEALLGGLPLPV